MPQFPKKLIIYILNNIEEGNNENELKISNLDKLVSNIELNNLEIKKKYKVIFEMFGNYNKTIEA